jgi:hypothetical protein
MAPIQATAQDKEQPSKEKVAARFCYEWVAYLDAASV